MHVCCILCLITRLVVRHWNVYIFGYFSIFWLQFEYFLFIIDAIIFPCYFITFCINSTLCSKSFWIHSNVSMYFFCCHASGDFAFLLQNLFLLNKTFMLEDKQLCPLNMMSQWKGHPQAANQKVVVALDVAACHSCSTG